MKPFHLAFPIKDIESTREFYGKILGCEIGRETDKWIDFNFFGHQLSAHVAEENKDMPTNLVDKEQVPVRHFGVIMAWHDWELLAERLKAHNIEFIIEPGVRFVGKVGEQGTFFLKDFSGNALEFKTFKDMSQVFAK